MKPEQLADVDPPGCIRRIQLFNCTSFNRRLQYHDDLVWAGATIQDFKYNFKAEMIEFKIILNCSLASFLEKFKKTRTWEIAAMDAVKND